jgi:integrase
VRTKSSDRHPIKIEQGIAIPPRRKPHIKPLPAGYLSKTDLRYWRAKIFQRSYRTAKGNVVAPDYWVQLQHAGRREKINLRDDNAEHAAAKARSLYLSLLAVGWEETLRRFKAGYGKPKRGELEIGEYLEAVARHTSILPRTLDGYAKALRRIAADIAGVPDSVNKFHPTKTEWRDRVDAIKLRKLTREAIEKWERDFIKAAGNDPLKEKSARISAVAFLRRARSLFGKKVLPLLKSVELPDPVPFSGIKIAQIRPPKYRATFDMIQLALDARKQLAPDRPEQYKIFLLGSMAGLRRNEIDKLLWSAFRWEESKIRIERTQYFRPKSEDSEREVEVDTELMEVFRDYYAQRGGEFVIESNGAPNSDASFDDYRCGSELKEVVDWLRGKGVVSKTPLHTLRKEYGSQICERFGLYAAQTALGHSDPKVTAQHYLEPKKRSVLGFGHLLKSNSNVVSISEEAPKRAKQKN